MKLMVRIISSLVCIIALVACAFSWWQARHEEIRLKHELERRANVIADSLRISVEPLLGENKISAIERIVTRFSNRERLFGISIHDSSETLVVASREVHKQLEDYPKATAGLFQQVEKMKSECGQFIDFGRKTMHAYTVPLCAIQTLTEDAETTITHYLTLFHDSSYIQERVNRIWSTSFWRAFVMVLVISWTTLILIYVNFMTPIKKTTEWIQRIRRGETPQNLTNKDKTLLGPLTEEIHKMATSLHMARLSAEEEARLRILSEAIWTPERLKEFVRSKLEGQPLFVVSNREPYMHIRKGKEIECIVPASGLVTAIEPVLKSCEGVWVAQGSGDADRETVDKKDRLRVPPEEPSYLLRRVWVDKEQEEGFYSGFSNEGLWPLCHIAHTRPIFRAKDWEAYWEVNKIFAEATLEEMEGTHEPNVLIQDYHFALLPAMIKEKRPDARVAIFWHIPWPNPESFGICPWRKEILQGMLGADVIGFHTQFHCNNFIESVDRFLESRIDYEHFTVNRERHKTWIKPFPISIDFSSNKIYGSAESPDVKSLLKKHGLQAEYIGVGVDRLDYTKGIVERFHAIESLMETHPEYRKKFTFVELGAPSRTMIPKYKEFIDEVTREVDRINARFKEKDWQPILLLMKHHSHAEIQPFYKSAAVCLVTSLHDGMNLVAKEFISARDDEKGVLILSQFTGASRELADALIVNPYDIRMTGEALHRALSMPLDEQQDRMKRMREIIREHNIFRWASTVIGALARIRLNVS